jgi:hypothetical protein
MNLAASGRAVRWLILDTFRHALWSGVFWFMLVVSGVCVLACLTVHFSDTSAASADAQLDSSHGHWRMLFGAIQRPVTETKEYHVRKLQYYIGGAGASTIGLVLALIFTAGFVPAFVDPNAAMVMLAKPIPRWLMLAGKSLGAILFVSLHAAIFVIGTWLAIGLATGVWTVAYLWLIPILILHFAVFYSFSVLLAVMTQNTVACVFGSLLFWLLCWGMNIGRHALVAFRPEDFTSASQFLSEVGYWILPKPGDLGIVTLNLLYPESIVQVVPSFAAVEEKNAFAAGWSMLASFVFAVAMLGLSGYELEAADY